MASFKERLAALGFASYRDYIASPHWKDFKHRYKTAGLPKLCAVCGHKKIQLHHHCYDRLGCEELEDVTPLCSVHHRDMHRWLFANGKYVTPTNNSEGNAFLKRHCGKRVKRRKHQPKGLTAKQLRKIQRRILHENTQRAAKERKKARREANRNAQAELLAKKKAKEAALAANWRVGKLLATAMPTTRRRLPTEYAQMPCLKEQLNRIRSLSR